MNMRLYISSIVLIVSMTAAGSILGAGNASQYRSFRIQRLDNGIYYGSAPRDDEDFAALQRCGVTRIVDIRTFKVVASAIEQRRAEKFGMTYHRIPTGFFPCRTGTVPEIMSHLDRPRCGSVFFHCNLGSDRTGMLVAIYRTEKFGWDPQAAFATWKSDQFNDKLEGLDRYFWTHVTASDRCRTE